MKKLLVITTLLLFAGIAFGQSLNKGNVISNWHFDVALNEDVAMNQYLDFLTKTYIPEFEKHHKGVTMILMKGNRGEQVDKIGLMLIFESLETRNKYWPNEGEASEEQKAANKKMKPVEDKMNELGTWEEGGFSDWVIL